MIGFPYALLYGDSKYGGVGLQRLSDTITIDKLRNLYACLQSDHFTASASNGLISRAARLQYGLTRPDQYLRLEPVKGATYYMKSILEWGKTMDCYLCRHGHRPAACTLDATLEEIATTPLTAKEVRTLHQHNTLTIGELIHDDTTNRRWNISQKLRWIRTKLPDQPPADKRMLLRPGQYWKAQTTHPPLRHGSVCEILHVTYDQLITFRHWTPTTYSATSKYRCKTEPYTLDRDSIFSGAQGQLVDLHKLREANTAQFINARSVPTPNAILPTQTIRPQ